MVSLCSVLLSLCVLLSGCDIVASSETPASSSYNLSNIPAYSGEPFVVLDEGQPDFPEEDKTTTPFERYSELDYLDRPGPAYANVCMETMPTEDREGIGQVKPAGWQTARYDFISGKYLYNRCHLIGFQLTGENANERNLITGTRYLNIDGMLPFEDTVADYVKETSNHVLYRVTPIYDGLNLLASGLEMEGWSVEDEGASICFDVYVYNVQPGVIIDYATGESRADENPSTSSASSAPENTQTYVINEESKKFHLPTCRSVSGMSAENRRDTNESRDHLISQGYSACGVCKP